MADRNTNTSPDRLLAKILLQEQLSGYQDTTVVGGMDRFLERWTDQLKPLIENIISYSTATQTERKLWAAEALLRLPDLDRLSTETKLPNRSPSTRRRSEALMLKDDVTRIRGVSKKILIKLQRLGINHVEDLLYFLPKRHNDFASIRKVSELVTGYDQTAMVTVMEASETRTGPRRRSTHAVLSDETGNIRVTWFNNPYIARKLSVGTRIVVSGKPNLFRGQVEFQSPEYDIINGKDDLLNTGRLVPVYPATEGLPQRTIRRIVKQAVDSAVPLVEEFLSKEVLYRTNVMGLREALLRSHYPHSKEEWSNARRRLAFDELLLLQLALLKRRREWQQHSEGTPLLSGDEFVEIFQELLPFRLTESQSSVLNEVLEGLNSKQPMNRMLQGDVGSGKTVIAAAALFAAACNGFQGALMVPTEVLAEQHFVTLMGLLSPSAVTHEKEYIFTVECDSPKWNITVGLLIGSLTRREKAEVQELLASGKINVVVGTHALIQQEVELPKLGLVVVDEQHRFGVMQRSILRGKGSKPHLLAMSATPIPRSLALTIYGDLDMSIIDEMPPGRQPIKTRWVNPDRRHTAYAFVEKQVSENRQAFIVCPLIEESEIVQSRAAIAEFERLSTSVFPELRLGLLHGRMPLHEKQQVMDVFKKGDLDILVSTPVIEVGIDVPNATVMLIDGADRFGLAQLHQFRGRVGRGRHQSYCLLLADQPSSDAKERLRVLERILDGFELAEEDLRLRGPGDYLGTRQSGIVNFRVARITDQDILSMARQEAVKILDSDPDLSMESNTGLTGHLQRFAYDL